MILAALIICHLTYPGDTRPQDWAYRTIDGKKCWYQGPRMLPKDRLQWQAPPMEPTWNLDGRYHGAKDGWEHKE
jgi:hypothetical protein